MRHNFSLAWHRPDRWPACGNSDVHVWRLPLTAIPERDVDVHLSADERTRAARFHFNVDRERFAVARGLLRVILGRYAGIDPAALVFSYGAAGKPLIEDPPDARPFTFNVSHSAGVALIAVARERAVGVDVERLREIEALEIAHRFFRQPEIDAVQTASGAERQRVFFSCWTRKESVLKACGAGLAASSGVEQRVVNGRRYAMVNGPPGSSSKWGVIDLDPGAGYVGALAVQDGDWVVSCWDGDVVW
jgi:4'-phosphopantetheinyl transferase